jgi:hypothetical protein
MYALVRDAIWEIRNQVQAPEALVAGSVLTAMSVACQGNMSVLLPTELIRPPSLFLAMFGQSGERKTTVDGLVCTPIYEHDKAYAAANADASAHYEATLRMWQAEDTALQRKLGKAVQHGEDLEQYRGDLVAHARLEPRKPAPMRIVHQNITERPLMEALQGDSKSIAILCDEGEIVLKGGAMSKMGLLNKVWDGASSLSLDRMDGHVQVTNPRMTVSFMIQEEVFQEFWDKRGRTARGSGHMARYLVAFPVSTVGFRRMTLQDHTWTHLPAFHERITELLAMADQLRASGDSRELLEFSIEAKELWVQSQNDIEFLMRPGGCYAGIKDFASKSLEIAGRVAAIFHYFNGLQGPISRETLERAMDVVGWHVDEFNRLFGEASCIPQLHRDVQSLGDYLLNEYWRQGLSKASWNQVRTYNGRVRDQRRFEEAMQELCRQGVVYIGYESTGRGKGKRYIYLNPQQFQAIAMI